MKLIARRNGAESFADALGPATGDTMSGIRRQVFLVNVGFVVHIEPVANVERRVGKSAVNALPRHTPHCFDTVLFVNRPACEPPCL